MKTLKKGLLALGLTLGIIASVGGSSVFAVSYRRGYVNGAYVTAESNISYIKATGQTLSPKVGLVTVTSRYIYVNTRTFNAGRQDKYDGDTIRKLAKVSFTAPNNTKSITITSSHKVSSYGETWTACTTNEYKG